MDIDNPVIAAVGLDATTFEVVRAATELARRVGAPIVPVHALPPRLRLKKVDESISAAREQIVAHFAPAVDEGITVVEPVIAREEPAALVVRTASMTGAQLIVVGGGEPETVKRWLLGSVAERVVHSARSPVFVARGTLPGSERPVVCPVDLSPQSHLGFTLALRMARLFDAPLRVVTVIPPDRPLWFGGAELDHSADRIAAKTREEMDTMIAAHDTAGVDLAVEVMGGRPVAQILDAASDAHLVVIGSGGFDYLLPGTFGSTTEKVLRGAWSSVLAVRDADPDKDARERHLRHVASLRRDAEARVESGDFEGAVVRARAALNEAPGHAGLYDLLGRALAGAGRSDDAATMKKLAQMVRDSLG